MRGGDACAVRGRGVVERRGRVWTCLRLGQNRPAKLVSSVCEVARRCCRMCDWSGIRVQGNNGAPSAGTGYCYCLVANKTDTGSLPREEMEESGLSRRVAIYTEGVVRPAERGGTSRALPIAAMRVRNRGSLPLRHRRAVCLHSDVGCTTMRQSNSFARFAHASVFLVACEGAST